MNLTCFLIPALVGVICGILGYLLGKRASVAPDEEYNFLKDDLDSCNRRNSQLRLDMERLRFQVTDTAKKRASFTETIPENKNVVPFDGTAVKTLFGKKINENDLKIIEGIGPKIEALFKNSEVLTWRKLSEMSVEKCQEILDKEGERFQIHDPGTWPRQAKLCYEGKWQELKDWQDILDGGKER